MAAGCSVSAASRYSCNNQGMEKWVCLVGGSRAGKIRGRGGSGLVCCTRLRCCARVPWLGDRSRRLVRAQEKHNEKDFVRGLCHENRCHDFLSVSSIHHTGIPRGRVLAPKFTMVTRIFNEFYHDSFLPFYQVQFADLWQDTFAIEVGLSETENWGCLHCNAKRYMSPF